MKSESLIKRSCYLYQIWYKGIQDTKPLKGVHGAGVVENAGNYYGNTYRVIYTTRLGGAIYVLHAFPKKSKTGIETPKQKIDLINSRLKTTSEYHELRFKK